MSSIIITVIVVLISGACIGICACLWVVLCRGGEKRIPSTMVFSPFGQNYRPRLELSSQPGQRTTTLHQQSSIQQVVTPRLSANQSSFWANADVSALFKDGIDEQARKKFEMQLMQINESYGNQQNPITCFISYAWGNQYTKIVQQLLVKDLRAAGLQIPIDVENGPGNNLTEFLDHIEAADFVVVVGSFLLLQKYRWQPSHENERQPVVKAELLRICGMANAGRYKKIRTLLMEGVSESALPPALSEIIRIENFKQGNYEGYTSGVLELVKSIYNIPQEVFQAILSLEPSQSERLTV